MSYKLWNNLSTVIAQAHYVEWFSPYLERILY